MTVLGVIFVALFVANLWRKVKTNRVGTIGAGCHENKISVVHVICVLHAIGVLSQPLLKLTLHANTVIIDWVGDTQPLFANFVTLIAAPIVSD
jgi:hypothetical protein